MKYKLESVNEHFQGFYKEWSLLVKLLYHLDYFILYIGIKCDELFYGKIKEIIRRKLKWNILEYGE